MAAKKRVNALVQMHCQALGRGMDITADATMFTVEELIELARAAAQSGYASKLRIAKSTCLAKQEKGRILNATADKKQVRFV